MNWIKRLIGNWKGAYIAYNFFHQHQLKTQKQAYAKNGLKRPAWWSVAHRNLKHLSGQAPWLDRQSLATIADENPAFQKLPHYIQQNIRNWSEEGYAVLPGLFSEDEVDIINSEIERLLQNNEVHWRYSGTKIMFAYRQSQKIRDIINKKDIQDTLNFLLGTEMELFQSINFFRGSGQLPHSDSVHMSTHPEGYLIAGWIALEDITEGSGPLTYYPGSHKLPYIHNEDFEHGGNRFMLGSRPYDGYEAKVQEILKDHNFEAKIFLPRKGDILIWHANLLHGGTPIKDPGSTRKSMVLHFFAKDVIAYHEITQRPALRN